MRSSWKGVLLLVLMIVLVASVLGVLGAATAHADWARAQKQAATATAQQDCVNRAQEWLAALTEEIRAGAHEGERLEKSFSDESGHTLRVELQVANGAYTILAWRSSTEWTDQQPLGELLRIN